MKIGSKVRHKINQDMEGVLVRSSFGVSVIGRRGDGTRFQTIGASIEETKQYWQRIYKFKNPHMQEKQTNPSSALIPIE